MKYSKWIGLGIYIGLIVVCFIPWTYHADLGKDFTGFFSEKNIYGKPGKFFIIFSVICVLMMFIEKVWAKFVHIFFAGVILAYALKTYHLYTSSYNAYSPEKQLGIYLLLILSVLSFVISLFPDMKIRK
jgi:hypothetical protein